PNDGIDQWNVSVALRTNHRGETPHEEARKKTYALLKAFTAAGWKHNIAEDMPRITGREAMRYFIEHRVLSNIPLDPAYLPTVEEWLSLPQPMRWSLYADGVYMNMMLHRETEDGIPTQPGKYYVSLEFQWAVSFWRNASDEKDRANGNWLPQFIEEKPLYAQRRKEAEAKIRAEGRYKIDTDYQSPDATLFDDGKIPPPLSHAETITCKSRETCPKTGYWLATSTDARLWNVDAMAKQPPRWVEAGQPMPTFSPPMLANREHTIVWQWHGENLALIDNFISKLKRDS
ncbi:hypothetical protein HZU77_016500, partial [Neisseriaceae bacterium TC5R-5]|nr:hypothetical protein [Neisseriaceae bacterium TC5R-5]